MKYYSVVLILLLIISNGCGYIKPISVRAFKNLKPLARALKIMSDVKNGEPKEYRVGHEEVLNAFELIAPYSGILEQTWVEESYKGNSHLAMEDILSTVRQDVAEKSDALISAFEEARNGKLSQRTKEAFTGKWEWYREILDEINTAATKYGKLDPENVDKAIGEYPIVAWLK